MLFTFLCKLANMNMTLAQRLIHARTESGYSAPAEAARLAGITASALYQLEDGTTKALSGQTAVKLARIYPNFRIEWLITGTGPSRYNGVERAESSAEPQEGYIRFRLMEIDASAGPGAINDEFPEVLREVDIAEWQVRAQLGFLPADGRVQIITVRGDSMHPKIKNGDVVMVDVGHASYDGDGVYLINVNGYTFIKRLQMQPDGLHIISTNPDYHTWVIPAGELDTLTICGRVVGGALLRSSAEL